MSLQQPLFFGSDIYRHLPHGRRHPLSVPRVSACIDLCRALGWLGEGDYIETRPATVAQLSRFHEPAYLKVLRRLESGSRLNAREKARYNIGVNGNPVFPEIFTRPATACGASLLAAERVRDGGVVFSPAGGTHHGRPGRASGFCYLNDLVLCIGALLDQGLTRILYLDIDAHHGDGVQDAFHDDGRVLTVSIHEDGRWPRTGAADDTAGGHAINVPVPPGFNDAEMHLVLESLVRPAAAAFGPQVVILQCGADALADDPMAKLELSNSALWRVVASVLGLAPRVIVTGGGGYNPWSVARAWAGVWATIKGIPIPGRLSREAESVLRGLTWHRREGRNPPERWFMTLRDAPNTAPVRAEVRDLVGQIRDRGFPAGADLSRPLVRAG